LGLGANSVDYVYRLPAYPQAQGPNAKMRISHHSLSCGGQVATALSTCASLGLGTKYIGVTGTDDNGRRIRDELARRGVDMTDAIIRDVTNQFAVIMVDEHAGERIVLWDRHEGLTLRPHELQREHVASSRVVHVDDVDHEAAIRAATLAREIGVPTTSDIDRLTSRTEDLVAAVSVPIFAEHVPPALTGEDDFERALRKLRRQHDGLLCVTLGPHGSMVLDGDRLHREPAFPVTAIDTTGAGDVFRGAFIYAYLRGDSPPEILRFANAAAAISCTRLGAINGVPTLEETKALLKPEARS
ncbi:MAG: carbohydrate kinase family protein, partial [Vicinamibacterales bacterium]